MRVTRDQFIKAKVLSPILNQAVIALDKLTDAQLGTDGEILAFKDLLASKLDKARNIIIDGDFQEKNRNQKLLSFLNTRLLALPDEISKLSTVIPTRQKNYDYQIEKLKFEGRNQAQINILCPPILQSDIDENAKQIESLKVDLKSIELFMSDVPEYRLSLLGDHLIEAYNATAKVFGYPLAEVVTEEAKAA